MNSYLLFKSLHLIAVISWMAGLLYLPRIFVYHVENFKDENSSSIFKTMERKLFFYIMTPAMILSWVFGLILISMGTKLWPILHKGRPGMGQRVPLTVTMFRCAILGWCSPCPSGRALPTVLPRPK